MCLDFRFTLVPVFLLLDFGVIDNGNIIPVDGDHVPQWFQNPNFPIRAVFGPANFKSAVLFFGATYSENEKCSETILYLILR